MDKLVSKSKYNKKSHKDFYRYHLIFKSSSTYFLLILTLGLFGLGIYNTINSIKTKNVLNIIMLWSLIVITITITIFQMFSRINKSVKQEAEARSDSVEIIEITKSLIVRRIENVSGREVIGWGEVNSIIEVRDYIFIYTFNDQGFFIQKTDIIEGNVLGFRELAKNNMKKNKRGKVNYKIKFKQK